MESSESESTRIRFGLHARDAPKNDLPIVTEREFGRVTVVLGANGSGKSRLLQSLTKNLLGRPVVYVEGGRAIRFSTTASAAAKGHADYVQTQSLTFRARDLFFLLELDRSQSVSTHKDALFKWDLEGADKSKKPLLRDSSFQRVARAFNKLFPHIKLLINSTLTGPHHSNGLWQCTNRGLRYTVDNLSDGEKQVFCLLADVGDFSPEKSFIIVDEPELNLHPSLAMNLWNLIEQQRKNAVFVYATHSLSFAM